MKTLVGAVALALAVPATAQSTPAADPHAGHAKHGATDHSKMMEKCKDSNASAQMKAHCAEMMKKHEQHQPASAKPQVPQSQHSH